MSQGTRDRHVNRNVPSAARRAGIRKQREAQAADLPDEFNPAYIFQGTKAALLVRCLGDIDLNALALDELANRGLNKDGHWVGFEQAKKEAAAEKDRRGIL
jgi:hypothetical protein